MDIQINISNPTEAVIRALAEAMGHSNGAAAPVHAEVAATTDAPHTDSETSESAKDAQEPAEETAPQTDKPKRQRKPQAEKAERTDAPDTKPEPSEPKSSEPAAPSVVDLRAKAQEVGTSPQAKKAIKALLDKFDSKSLSEVSEDNRAEFLAELAAIPAKLAEGEDA